MKLQLGGRLHTTFYTGRIEKLLLLGTEEKMNL